MTFFHGTRIVGRWLGAVAAVGALALGPLAFGQQRAGGNGRALDANPRAGSGGNNRLEGQVDYGARNDVITGNVPGLGAFQGNVPYAAPGEFQGQRADNLFQFRRQSYESAPGTPPSYRNSSVVQPPVVLYDDFSTAPRGQIGSGGPNSFGNLGAGAYSNAEVSGLQVTRNSLRANGGLVVGSGGAEEQTLGYITSPQGQTLQLSASPLLGVRQRAVTGPGGRAAQGGQSTSAQGDQAQSEEAQNADALDQRYQPPGQELLNELGQPQDRGVEAGAPGNPQPAGGPDQAQAGQAPGADNRIAPGLVLGERMQTRVTGRQSSQPRTLDQELARLQSRIFRPLDQRVTAPGADPYLDILRRMRGEKPNKPKGNAANAKEQNNQANANQPNESDAGPGARGNDNNRNDNGNANTNTGRQNGENAPGSPGSSAAGNKLPPWAQGLKMPKPKQLHQAEQARANALAQQQNQGKGHAAGSGNQPGGEAAQGGDRKFNRFMNELSYNMPRLKTLVSERKGRVAKQMKRGEQALGEGRFFDAEDAYRRALTDEPDNPLARAGLVNAQLAAGLIRSASLNLRKLYADHPELIAARYDPKLLPPTDRLQWLQSELTRMISQDNQSADPGLMMAYLGHQVDSRQLVRYGLAVARAKAPRDALLPVLRRIWLGGKHKGKNADQ